MTLPAPYLLSLFLVFVRTLAVLMTTPLFNSSSIPTVVKVGFGGVLAAVILPVSTTTSELLPMPTEVLPFALMVAQEILIGVVIGFVSNLVFAAVSMAAGMMGLQIGLGAANLFNPFMNTSSSALEQFYTLTTLVLFLSINGHHWLITALARTFDTTPIGGFVLDEAVMNQLVRFASDTFAVALRIALPIVGTMLLTDVGLGLVARAVPQIQVYFLGMPLKIALGLLIVATTLALTLPHIQELLLKMPNDVVRISATRAGGN